MKYHTMEPHEARLRPTSTFTYELFREDSTSDAWLLDMGSRSSSSTRWRKPS
jgi:hypothetical protein